MPDAFDCEFVTRVPRGAARLFWTDCKGDLGAGRLAGIYRAAV
jgi:hypothetical protein